jgi:predicted aldo/keto reductase-like oxidoreductase
LKYRKFGSSEWQSSVLGIGTAGVRLCEDAPESFEPEASVEMIRLAIDRGINYLDLGYPYDLLEHAQIARSLGEALLDGYRGRAKLAVTLPSHLLKSKSDFDRYLDHQISLLKIDRADFCLFGRLNRETWPILRRLNALDWAEATIGDGRVGGIGFSLQDDFQVLRQITGAYDHWCLCQFQFSYMDMDRDPGIGGIRYAALKGMAVVVTEPLKSGRLIEKPPRAIAKIWGDEPERGRLAKWGLRFVWSYPEVAVAVRDFRSTHDLIESADIADSVELHNLTVQEELLINRVRDEYRKRGCIPCSSCRPCMPCPEGIDVPRIFEIYNDAFIYEDLKTARLIYLSEQHHAELCNQCRDCEKRCARKLKIVDWLEKAHRLLGGSE